MNLSITQVQNVLRTYQRQVREDRVRAVLGIREESPAWQDRVDISREGRSRLGDNGQEESGPGEAPGRKS